MSSAPAAINESDIAIVGMAGRFPGARNVDRFWRNIRDGVECISFFSPDQLRMSGIPMSLSEDPAYVPARAVLDDVELFEPGFFGFSPREGSYMDPQHRLFLECAWEAMEDAGYDPFRYDGAVGIYAGASTNSYLMATLSHGDLVAAVNDFQTIVGNDKDFLATRVSYHLNLRGPSVNVQTACSTSLVAVHMACQSLLTGECDMALAGGVSVRIPQQSGYLYQRGGILSHDGHCRAFDAAASGTVGGNGAGIVLLKRLDKALEDGDQIRAVIKGSATNNDGAHKIGFTAPSVAGQAAVIAEALGVAGVEPNEISYVEAHGTGTTLGDPIEIEALNEVFGSESTTRSCAIGSLKTNIGHLDAAAGIAGLIKTVLALQRQELPPSLNCTATNPKIRFQDGPFYVNRALAAWGTDRLPRRAGVSSFGIGGTNAHVILEEAPPRPPADASSWPQLVVLSARSSSALEQAAQNLSHYLTNHADVELANVAFTLQTGRKAFRDRRAVVGYTGQEVARALAQGEGFRAETDGAERSVAFMFSGQGSHTRNMAGELYLCDPVFRYDIDDCARILEPLLGTDIRTVLYPPADRVEADDRLAQTRFAQPALFVVQYALARLWMSWGVRPAAMIGHSLGEYVAACIAGVFSLSDALTLVAARGRLMQELPPGAMLSVQLPEDELRPILTPGLSIAAVNGPSMCVASGATDAVAVLERTLQEREVQYRPLPVNRAFHSQLTETMLDAFRAELKRVQFVTPQIPFVSNVSGDWIRPDEATSPAYWTDHLRQTVRFGVGIETISRDGRTILLEVAPAATLTTLTRLQFGPRGPLVVSSLRPPQEQRSAVEGMLSAAAKLWTYGVEIDWRGLHRGERRYRVPLPTYPFERRRCWIDSRPLPATDTTATLRADPSGVSAHPRPLSAIRYEPPQSDLENRLVEIWQELLAIERIGINDNFFELGGHSLLLTRLVERLRETFDVQLPLEEVFQRSTIRELADLITRCVLESVEQLSDDEAQRLLHS
jgi:acyl transferase domain-containing protein